MLVLVSKPLLPCPGLSLPQVLLLAWLGWASMVMADVERPVVQHHLHVGCFKDCLLWFFLKKDISYEFLWNSMISTMIFYVCLLIPPWLDPIDFIDTWDIPKVGQRAELAGRMCTKDHRVIRGKASKYQVLLVKELLLPESVIPPSLSRNSTEKRFW